MSVEYRLVKADSEWVSTAFGDSSPSSQNYCHVLT